MDFNLFKGKESPNSGEDEVKSLSSIKDEVSEPISKSSQNFESSIPQPSSIPEENFDVKPNSEESSFQNPFLNESSNETQDKNEENLFEEQESPSNSLSNENILSKEEISNMIEENVEKILADKWEDILKNIDKVLNWKEKTDSKFIEVQESIQDIRKEFLEFQKKISTKIENYDGNILDINSDLKAFGMVFEKTLPTLVNNINELTEITNNLREIRNKSKEDNSN